MEENRWINWQQVKEMPNIGATDMKKLLFQVQSSFHGLGEKKCYQKVTQEAILPFRNRRSTQEA